MSTKKAFVPHLGKDVVFVPREQLRLTQPVREFIGLPALQEDFVLLPAPPGAFDGSKGRTITYPELGNAGAGAEGDCYLADALHCVQTWTGQVGPEAQFDRAAVLALYERMSGGDNGLGDTDVFPAWKGVGFFGHKILDEMTVDPQNDELIRLGLSLFCGGSWTAALPDDWYQRAAPGVIWDVGRPNQANGHAMHLSGYDAGYYHVETWGFDRAVRLTPAGLKSADPEVTLQFSLEMFDARGVAPHNGMRYEQLAALWQQCGGRQLPPSPFPAPGPPPGPTPVPPGPNPTPPPGPAPTPPPFSVVQLVDTLFQILEAAAAGQPFLVSCLKLANALIDDYLEQVPPPPGRRPVQGALDHSFPPLMVRHPRLHPRLQVARNYANAYLRKHPQASAGLDELAV